MLTQATSTFVSLITSKFLLIPAIVKSTIRHTNPNLSPSLQIKHLREPHIHAAVFTNPLFLRQRVHCLLYIDVSTQPLTNK